MSQVYVYALLRGPGSDARIAGRQIEMIASGPILAAVERVSVARAVTEESVMTQHTIVQRLCRTYPAVLPALFCSLVEERDLARTLKTHRRAIEDAFDLVSGRVQMTLRFELPPFPAGQRSPRSRGATGTAYLEHRRKAATALPPVAQIVRNAVADIVRAVAVDVRIAERQAVMFHLIDRADVKRYRARLARVDDPDADSVHASGPWPPFGFTPDLWS